MNGTPERPTFMEEEPVQRAENFAVRTPLDFLPVFIFESWNALRIAPDRSYNLSLSPDDRPGMGIRAMWLEFYGKDPRIVFETLCEAVDKGFSVRVTRDVGYSKMNRDEDFLVLPPTVFVDKEKKQHRMWVSGFVEKRWQILKEKGAEVLDTHPLRSPLEGPLLPFTGRDHEKIVYITYPRREREVAWLLGMNIAQVHFGMIDCIVEFTDPRIVQPLRDEFSRVGKRRRTKSVEISCTEDTRLIVGSGKGNLKKFIDVINSASETLYVMSAFPPVGEFLKALNKAAQEKNVHIVYATSEPQLLIQLIGAITAAKDLNAPLAKRKIPLVFPRGQLVHGKVIIADKKVGVAGSDNFIGGSHEEISVISENPEFVRNLDNFFRATIGLDNLQKKFTKDTIINTPSPI